MSSRLALLALTGALLSACGNFSNEDLVFMNALPKPEQLRARIPSGTLSSGLQQRGDGLNVGEKSNAYANTQTYAEGFNANLGRILTVIEMVRRWPPTHREPNRRIWGPANDVNQLGFEVQLTLERDPDSGSYDWWIEHRRRRGGEFFKTLTGHFEPTTDVRVGSGDIHFQIETARAGGLNVEAALGAAKAIDITYDTVPPLTLTQHIGVDGPHDIEYGYVAQQDASGQSELTFGYDNPSLGFQRIHALSRWTPTGSGRGDVRVLEGVGSGATQIECWDSLFAVTYFRDFGLATSGDVSRCDFGAP